MQDAHPPAWMWAALNCLWGLQCGHVYRLRSCSVQAEELRYLLLLGPY